MDISMSREEEDNIHVEERFKTANYSPKIVIEELKRISQKRRALRQLVNLKKIRSSIIGRTWPHLLFFIILYYSLQIAYQLDWFCYFNDLEDESIEECRKWLEGKFKEWREYEKFWTRLVTFLMGFYVSLIAKRWWDQISRLPSQEKIGLMMGGLVFAKEGSSKTSREAALCFKKTIARYALLSWTMCLGNLPGSSLGKKMRTAKDFIEKGLLTKNEATLLKITDRSSTAWTIRWCSPLAWATTLTNDAFNNTGLIPKDHKDLIGLLCRFKDDLHILSEYHSKPLPAIYSQAVWMAVVGWLLVGTLEHQDEDYIESDCVVDFIKAIIFDFPLNRVFIYMVVFGWLRVAEILQNPFGSDKLDIDLAELLDLEIWKSSVLIESQESFLDSCFAKNPAEHYDGMQSILLSHQEDANHNQFLPRIRL